MYPYRTFLGYELPRSADQNINWYARIALREQDRPRQRLAIRHHHAEYQRRYAGGTEANPWAPGTKVLVRQHPKLGKALPVWNGPTRLRAQKATTPTWPRRMTQTRFSRFTRQASNSTTRPDGRVLAPSHRETLIQKRIPSQIPTPDTSYFPQRRGTNTIDIEIVIFLIKNIFFEKK